MFLTKKGFKKILVLGILYFVLGTVTISLSVLFMTLGISGIPLLMLGVLVYVLCVLVVLWGLYAEGKAKWINLSNKLVRSELKPAEFLKKYEELKGSNDLVIKKPSYDVLMHVAVAYDCLDEREKALAVLEEMVDVAPEKKKSYALLVKTSFLFGYGETEEAEKLFNELQASKLGMMERSLADAILKSDRAMAMGDYKVAEAHNLKLLDQRFPPLDKLSVLVVHNSLAKVYEKMNDCENAVIHYQYCKDNGGKTAVRSLAEEALKRYLNC